MRWGGLRSQAHPKRAKGHEEEGLSIRMSAYATSAPLASCAFLLALRHRLLEEDEEKKKKRGGEEEGRRKRRGALNAGTKKKEGLRARQRRGEEQAGQGLRRHVGIDHFDHNKGLAALSCWCL